MFIINRHLRGGRAQDSTGARESAQQRDPGTRASTSTAGGSVPAPQDELTATRPSHDARSVASTSAAGPSAGALGQEWRQPARAGSHPSDAPHGELSNAIRAWAPEGDELWSDSPAPSAFDGWNELEHEPRADFFATFITRLRLTEDALAAKRYVQARLANVLIAMKKDVTLRAIGFSVAFDVLDTDECHDRTALGFQEIELAIKAHELGDPPIPDLIELGKQYFRLNVIEEAAKETKKSRLKARGKSADFGEILIAFQTHVKDEFDLPIDVEKMHYTTSEYVSERDIEFAKKRVAEKENSQEMVEFLTQFKPLKKKLKQSSPDRFNDLRKSFKEKEAALSIIPEGWSEGKYMEETNALKVEKAAAKQALYRTLTHEAVEKERGRGPEIRAKNQYNRGNRLRGLGWNEAALKPTRDAVGRYRELATTNPDTFGPDLVKSLRSLLDTLKALNIDGEALKAMNLDGEALEAGREAVDLYRELAAARPDAFRPDLADSLCNLSKQLCARNRPEEALEVGREAVKLYRTLAAARPAFRPHLTGILDDLKKQARARNQHKRALTAKLKAVRLDRWLVAIHLTSRSRLADSLDSLGKMLADLDRHEEALGATGEAVELYRKLIAENHPELYFRLSDCLDRLSKHLSALGRLEEARKAAREAKRLHPARSVNRHLVAFTATRPGMTRIRWPNPFEY